MSPTKDAKTATIAGFKIDHLTHDNYAIWKDRARAVLKQSKTGDTTQWKIITADVKPWDSLSATEQEIQEDAKDFLNLLISQEVWVEIRHLNSGSEIWKKLEEKNEGKVASRQALFEQQLDYTVFGDKDTMQGYITRVTSLVTQIRAVGGTVSDVNYTGHLLRGLPSKYNTVKVICNSKRGDVDAVKNELLGEEARQKGEQASAQSS